MVMTSDDRQLIGRLLHQMGIGESNHRVQAFGQHLWIAADEALREICVQYYRQQARVVGL
jgi:hypothetical protein